MKTLETAKAEAESIATRWVPAHMTARRGLVDDIAAALLGAAVVGYETHDSDLRRLVEEAQAETRRVSNEAQFRLLAVGAAAEEARTETDRLKFDMEILRQSDEKGWAEGHRLAVRLDDLYAERDRLKGELSMERNAYDKTLYRLKSELAEAQRASGQYQSELTESLDEVEALEGCLDRERQWRKEKEAVIVSLRKQLAATPAEQAQGEGAKPTGVEFPRCSFPCEECAMDGGMCSALRGHGGAVDLPKEGDECDPGTEDHFCERCRSRVNKQVALESQVAALAKRVEALTARLDRITSPPPRPFVSEIKRHWDDPAVRDNFVDATLDDHEARLRDIEWRFKTEGEKP
jgi:hypothetical protein